MTKEAIQNLLDKYFTEAASTAEIEQVNQLKSSNPEFKIAFEEHYLFVEGIRAFRRNELKKLLKESLRNHPTTTSKKAKIRFLNPTILQIAAAITLLLMVTIGIYRNATFHERTYVNFQPDRVNIIKAGGSETDTETIDLLKNRIRYVMGVELSKTGNFAASLDSLSAVSMDVELYFFWAQYEIALIHLLKKDTEAAKVQLEKLLDMEGEHIAKDKAKKLLEEL